MATQGLGVKAPITRSSSTVTERDRLLLRPPAETPPAEYVTEIDLKAHATEGYVKIKFGAFSILIEASALTRNLTLREVDWCEPGAPEPKKVLVLMSEPYDAA